MKPKGKKFKTFLEEEKKRDPLFAQHFDSGYDEFKIEVIGELLKEARKQTGLTQEELAEKLHTKKSAICRLENHCADVRLSTLLKVSKALGKKLDLRLF